MKKLLTIIIYGIAALLNVVHAQSVEIDSIKNVLGKMAADTTKVITLNELAKNYWISGDYESAIKYTEESRLLAEQIGYKKGVANSNNGLGLIYMDKGEFDTALNYFNYSLKVRGEINDRKGIADSYNNIGLIFDYVGNYSEALTNYYKSLKIYDALNLQPRVANSYNNIGLIYQSQGKYAEAISIYTKALELYKKYDDVQGVSIIYNNMGNIYHVQGKYEQALENHKESLKLKEITGDKQGIATSYNNIGSILRNKKEYKSALEQFFIALKLFEEMDDKQGMTGTCNNIGITYVRLNNLSEADKYLKRGLQLAREINFMEEIKLAYEGLTILDSTRGNFRSTYENYKMSIVYRDSLINEKNTEQTIQSQMQYEFDKKQLADSLQLADERKMTALKFEGEKKQRYLLYGGLIMVLVFAGFMYNRYKVTQKQKEIITQKEQETQRQKKEVEHQKLLIEEKNHEITQSIQYAQKIQSALLPNEEIFRTVLPDSFILFKPKDIVSGDYYWLSDREEYVFYATADCTGHGVPGGFMSMLGTALLNEIIDERRVEDCGEVLTLMREKIMQALKQAGDSESKDGMDMVLIRLNKKTLEMQYAAANNSLYIISNMQSAISKEYCILQTADCQLFELMCDKMPVGVYHSEVKPFRTYTHQLQKGDIIYTYTDGYADQFGGEKGKKYTYKKLREKLVAISQEPLAKQKAILENEFESWRAGQEQIDDVCLIGVKL